jgi:hypothetical protein
LQFAKLHARKQPSQRVQLGSRNRSVDRDAQRAIPSRPSRVVDAPRRRCFFRSLSLNSDFKVVNVLVLNSRWLWGERGSRKTQRSVSFVRVGIRNVRAHAQVGPRKNIKARAPSQARRHAGSVCCTSSESSRFLLTDR